MTDHADAIHAAETRLAAATADVERLRAKLSGELADAKAATGSEAGRAEARRRGYGKPSTETTGTTDHAQDAEPGSSSWADGVAEARRRFRS